MLKLFYPKLIVIFRSKWSQSFLVWASVFLLPTLNEVNITVSVFTYVATRWKNAFLLNHSYEREFMSCRINHPMKACLYDVQEKLKSHWRKAHNKLQNSDSSYFFLLTQLWSCPSMRPPPSPLWCTPSSQHKTSVRESVHYHAVKIDGTRSNSQRRNPLWKSVISAPAHGWYDCVGAAWASERSTLSDGLQRDRMRTSQVSEFVQTDRSTHIFSLHTYSQASNMHTGVLCVFFLSHT